MNFWSSESKIKLIRFLLKAAIEREKSQVHLDSSER